MATVERVILSCDWCESEDDTVRTHEFELEGKRLTLEADAACWETATVKELLDTGRRVRRPRLPRQK